MQRFSALLLSLALAHAASASAAPPQNDDFATRMRFISERVTVTANSAEATREEGEPELFHGLGVTLWWGYTAPKTGKVRVTGIVGDEMWPNPDVRARLFIGESLETLVDYNPWGFSLSSDGSQTTEFEVIAGMEYQIMTDTIVPAPHIGYRGPVTLSFEYLPTPTNDAFANRMTVTGDAALVSGTTEGATREAMEPRPEKGYDEHTVWYSWTPDTSGRANFVFTPKFGSEGKRLVVYTNHTLASLVPVVLDDCCSYTRNSFSVTGGQMYHLAVSSPFNETSPFEFALSLNARPVLTVPTFTHFGIVVNVFGQRDRTYRVESSTNLVNWTPLSSGGYVDDSAPTPRRFYRAVLVPEAFAR